MIFLSPGVKTREIDYSTYVGQLSSCVVGMVGGATKGPLLTPTLITSPANFADVFGEPSFEDPARGAFSALEFLKRGNQLYYVRVAGPTVATAQAKFFNGYLFAKAKYPGTGYGNISVGLTEAEQDFKADTIQDKKFNLTVYKDNSAEEQFTVSLDETADDFICNVNSYFVTFETDPEFAQQPEFEMVEGAVRNGTNANKDIYEIVRGYHVDNGKVSSKTGKLLPVSALYKGSYLYTEAAGSPSDPMDYTVCAPTDTMKENMEPLTLFFDGEVLSATAEEGLVVSKTSKNKAVFAFDPSAEKNTFGDWASKSLSVRLKMEDGSEVDRAISIYGSSVLKFTVNGKANLALTYPDKPGKAGDTFTKSVLLSMEPRENLELKIIPDPEYAMAGIGSFSLPGISFDSTMYAVTEQGEYIYKIPALGAKYYTPVLTLEGVWEDEVVPSGLDLNLQTDFTLPVSTELQSVLVTGSDFATDPVVSLLPDKQTVRIVYPDVDLFDLDNSITKYDTTIRMTSKNGAVSDEKVRYTMIVGAGDFADYMENLDNDGVGPTKVVQAADYGNAEGVQYLTDGNDGLPINDPSPVVVGINKFNDTAALDVNIIAAPGYSDYRCTGALISVAEARADAMAFIDPPFGLGPQSVTDWHNGRLANEMAGAPKVTLNTSYGALFYPWVQITDIYSGQDVWVPPSGVVCGAYAASDEASQPWFAAAGLERGTLPSVVAIQESLDDGTRDLLYGNLNAVNPIVNYKGQGVVIWGQKTLLRKTSALDRVNVRRMVNAVRKSIAISTAYLLFDLNDESTWARWVSIVTPYLESVQAARGLYAFKVKMDAETVTDYHKDRNEMPGKIWLQPTKTAEFISIDFILTNSGAQFDDAEEG